MKPAPTDEYLTIKEVAGRLRLSVKRVRNLMAVGAFLEGVHFFRRAGIRPRFRWSRVVDWLEADQPAPGSAVPMAKSRERRIAQVGEEDL
jgi:hypothetical protein